MGKIDWTIHERSYVKPVPWQMNWLIFGDLRQRMSMFSRRMFDSPPGDAMIVVFSTCFCMVFDNPASRLETETNNPKLHQLATTKAAQGVEIIPHGAWYNLCALGAQAFKTCFLNGLKGSQALKPCILRGLRGLKARKSRPNGNPSGVPSGSKHSNQ